MLRPGVAAGPGRRGSHRGEIGGGRAAALRSQRRQHCHHWRYGPPARLRLRLRGRYRGPSRRPFWNRFSAPGMALSDTGSSRCPERSGMDSTAPPMHSLCRRTGADTYWGSARIVAEKDTVHSTNLRSTSGQCVRMTSGLYTFLGIRCSVTALPCSATVEFRIHTRSRTGPLLGKATVSHISPGHLRVHRSPRWTRECVRRLRPQAARTDSFGFPTPLRDRCLQGVSFTMTDVFRFITYRPVQRAAPTEWGRCLAFLGGVSGICEAPPSGRGDPSVAGVPQQ